MNKGRIVLKTICHEDGTITYWSVYEQRWIEREDDIPDRELATMSTEERNLVIRHLGLMDVMTPERQLNLWVEGISVHNPDRDECCPDFSCCGTPIVDKETRLQFKNANEEDRYSMLASFLTRMLVHEGIDKSKFFEIDDSNAPTCCELCGTKCSKSELRPYGPDGQWICFNCGKKDEKTTKENIASIMNGNGKEK